MRDLDIRQALWSRMTALHADEPGTKVVDELELCQGRARVDVAVINGLLHGYEIKSERDSLARLESQIHIYNRALDRVSIATSENHLKKVLAAVPEWWGVWLATGDDGIQLDCQREASENPAIDPLAQAQLLWRDEALQVLAQRRLDAGMRSKTRSELWLRIAKEFPASEVGLAVREVLKRRDGWRAAELPT